MSVGTPNFIGERLTEAREARGLNMSQVAELVGVTRAAISIYEKGQSSPQYNVLASLSKVLNVPTSYFLKEKEISGPALLFYRSMANTRKSDRKRAERKYNWLREITSYLKSFVGFPDVRLPNFREFADLEAIDSKSVRSAADHTRRTWGLGNGPISDVMLLVENNGVLVSKSTFETERMDGYSAVDFATGTPCIIIAYDKGSAARSRFDLAHELGHLVLHRNLPSQVVNNPKNTPRLEEQAHEFAGAFLLPEAGFAADLGAVTLDNLMGLKGKWGVSVAAMLQRVRHLGWISDEQSTRLWKNLSRREWRIREPWDDLVEAERPRLIRRAFELIVEKRVREPGQILAELRLPATDICELACLSPRFFENPSGAALVRLYDANSGQLNETESYSIEGDIPQSRN